MSLTSPGRGLESAAVASRWQTLMVLRAEGTPKGQPRARAFAFKAGGRTNVRMYDPATAEGWKECVAAAVRQCETRPPFPLGLAVRVDSCFLFPRPQRLLKKSAPAERIPHTSKPDRDNLDKAVLDCLTTLGIWHDDAQVCGGEIEKWYAAKDERPGAIIRIGVREYPITKEGNQ